MAANTWTPHTRDRAPAEPFKPVVDPAEWYPADMADKQHWIYHLSDLEIAEIDAVGLFNGSLRRRHLDCRNQLFRSRHIVR